jgi:chemotaxis family two-component system response regulator Rcp1
MTSPHRILLIEDNLGDIRLVQEAYHETALAYELQVAQNGIEALAYLRQEKPFENAPRPQLILLDLNLPRKHGLEVLAEIKSDPDLHMIPVIVLTTSNDQQDICRSYEHQANSYITKPADLDAFIEVVKSLAHYWFSIVSLPR